MPHYSTRDVAQIFVVPADGGTPVQLTRLTYAPSQLAWTPDSATILFSADPSQDDEYKQEPTSDSRTAIARTGGEPRLLTAAAGSELVRLPSPGQGTRLAFQSLAGRGAETDILVVDIAPDGTFRGQPRNLTAEWSRVLARRGGRRMAVRSASRPSTTAMRMSSRCR